MKHYYRLMLGRKSAFAKACVEDGYIGVDFRLDMDLSGQLPERWQDFNQQFLSIWLEVILTNQRSLQVWRVVLPGLSRKG